MEKIIPFQKKTIIFYLEGRILVKVRVAKKQNCQQAIPSTVRLSYL